ncbi:MAG: ribosome small subunit-dependent GTPase A [Treponema sp.]|jgi:ribosome biogenesis GTPase|nr:ribosome small subunit-dependent GTPase A [Treponema sp.]
MRGLIIRGTRNTFTVRLGGEELECPLKGKVLRGAEGYYNPLAPGDLVEVEPEGRSGRGLILGLEKRRNSFTRFNQKGLAPQLLAANVDLVLCVTTPGAPPFRPRFLDRLLVQAERAEIPAAVLLNKADLGAEEPDTAERLEDYCRIGYPVLRVSARSGAGMEGLRSFIEGKCSVLAGQSGVGKSSLIKALAPGLEIRIGALNEKYDRGNHTTTQGILLDIPGGARIIDTPGIRRFVPDGVEPGELGLYMREFAPLWGQCTYGASCSHRSEPGCKVLEAVDAGVIHEDRYESFLRIREELTGHG